MIHRNCTCEYCCSARDIADDKEMGQEHMVAMFKGKKIFDELEVGGFVKYYRIPFEDRKIVYLPEELKWKHIEECATVVFQGEVLSKNDNFAEIGINGQKQRVTAAECWGWGLHKLLN